MACSFRTRSCITSGKKANFHIRGNYTNSLKRNLFLKSPHRLAGSVLPTEYVGYGEKKGPSCTMQ